MVPPGGPGYPPSGPVTPGGPQLQGSGGSGGVSTRTWLLVLLGIIAVALLVIVILLFTQGSSPASSPAPSQTASAVATAAVTPTPAETPTQTPSETPTAAPTETPTSALTPTPTPTVEPTPSPAPTPTPTPTPTPVPTPKPTLIPSIPPSIPPHPPGPSGSDLCEPSLEAACSLAAGDYYPRDFLLATTFTIPGGWSAQLYAPDRFTITDQAGGISVALVRQDPSSYLDSLTGNSQLQVTAPEPGLVGNIAGQQVDVTNTSASPATLLTSTGKAALVLQPGNKARIAIAGNSTTSVVIVSMPAVPDIFDTALSLWKPVLDSIRFWF